ncbi:MAG: efflux RND transporter periplasmic adaptor subunit [Planctomycetota bacterium]
MREFARGLAILLVGVGVGCSKEEPRTTVTPRPVVVHVVETPQERIARSFSGATAAVDSAELPFEVSGRITQVFAAAGKQFEAGSVLAQLDVSNYEADLRRAQAESSRANDELRRVQQLFETDNASRAQFDSAMAAQKTAEANLSTAQKRVRDGTIRMPYDGVIGEVLREEQEFVSAGIPVVRVQGDVGMEVTVGVPAELIGLIEPGAKAPASIGSLPGVRIEATVTEISRQVSRNTTYPVTLTLAPSAGVDIREGLDAEVTFELPNPTGPTVTIPAECVVGAPPAQTYVWVVRPTEVDAGVVERRPVETGGLRSEGRVEILNGLAPGEVVVTRGVHRLVAETPVRLNVDGRASS